MVVGKGVVVVVKIVLVFVLDEVIVDVVIVMAVVDVVAVKVVSVVVVVVVVSFLMVGVVVVVVKTVVNGDVPDTVLAPVLVNSVVFPTTASVVMTCSRVGNTLVTVELSFVVKIVSIAGSVVNECVVLVTVLEVLIPLVVVPG